jgi:hypothetical protein
VQDASGFHDVTSVASPHCGKFGSSASASFGAARSRRRPLMCSVLDRIGALEQRGIADQAIVD